MSKRSIQQGVPLLVMALLVLATGNCGKRGDPIPPGIVLPPMVESFKAVRSDKGIALHWSQPGPLEKIGGFKIFRSEVVTAGTECPGCPREFIKIVDLSLRDPHLARDVGNNFHYMDSRVLPGRLYSYQIVTCDGAGLCSEPSEMAELKY